MNALLAATLSIGMQADYASLIEKHQMGMIREADKLLRKLLAINGQLHHLQLAGSEAILSSL